jgi:hypothetical protein
MSQSHNNNFLHNIRVGVLMVNKGMHPEVASLAMEKKGIIAPPELLAAAATPGVMESMSAKPFTHKEARQQIAAHQSMQESLAEIEAQSGVVHVVFDED